MEISHLQNNVVKIMHFPVVSVMLSECLNNKFVTLANLLKRHKLTSQAVG
jgi:hypothetical protein